MFVAAAWSAASVSGCISDLRDVVDGGLHAPQLRSLDVQQLQNIVG